MEKYESIYTPNIRPDMLQAYTDTIIPRQMTEDQLISNYIFIHDVIKHDIILHISILVERLISISQ